MTWKDIPLYRFQFMDSINNDPGLDALDKVLHITCAVYGLSEEELDNMPVKKANKRIREAIELSKTQPAGRIKDRIGSYYINYDPSSMTLGQFVELRHFLQEPVHMGHLVLASIASLDPRVYQSDGHPLRADYFLRQPVTVVMTSLNHFGIRFNNFLREYKGLFGLDKEMYADGQESQRFNKHYGWMYSATQIAEHERITLDDAYGLPIRQAFNDLAYLKAKGRYEAEQHKQIMKGLKT